MPLETKGLVLSSFSVQLKENSRENCFESKGGETAEIKIEFVG